MRTRDTSSGAGVDLEPQGTGPGSEVTANIHHSTPTAKGQRPEGRSQKSEGGPGEYAAHSTGEPGEGLRIAPASGADSTALDELPEGRLVWVAALRLAGTVLLLASLGGGLVAGLTHHGAQGGHHGRHRPGPVPAAQQASTGRRRFVPDGPVAAEGTASLQAMTPKAGGEKPMPPDGPSSPPPETPWIHRGRLHYEAGCHQLYVGGEYFNLENNARARWCLVFLTGRGAFSPETAGHFLNEIDVFVRGKTGHAASPNVRIHEYFRDGSGRLDYLRQLLIRCDWGSGKYYLGTSPG